MDNKKQLDDILQKLLDNNMTAYNELPIEIKMFVQTNYYKNKAIFENKQIF